MDVQVLWWQWVLLGMGLIMLEMFLPSFIALWFGLGAIVVGLLVWLFPAVGVSWAVFIWVFASGAFVLLWFKVFKPSMVDKTKAGISRDAALGETGQVVRAPHGEGRGVVRFTMPVLGENEWDFICKEGVLEGDKVFIMDFSGNTLIVAKSDA
ncbi:hypothetical protein A9Q89_09440 [Gammaproteobacteria bacterium 53_120_T64]|nr:hypothetical protein A9Q89_09440 [Gammaproteobacteria bacterium 53_120_T64]